MPDGARHQSVKRLLVVMPTWLGDCVMATPTLRALRKLYPSAHIKVLLGKNVRPVLDGVPWVDAFVTIRPAASDPLRLSRRLALGRFDTAVLLSNSFKVAALVAMAGIRRRIGYDRDGRGFLLTDRLIAPRHAGRFTPVPALNYYLCIAEYLGAQDPDTTMQLSIRPEDEALADELLARAGYDRAAASRLVLLNPGAQKPAKRWSAERFAEIADRCAGAFGATVAVTGAPSEYAILRRVGQATRAPVINLLDHGLNLRLLKAVIRRAALLITNDTGPRHIAAALGTPVVTLFGPTGPEWTEIGFADERQVVAPAALRRSAPAQRSMQSIGVDAVFAKSAELLYGSDRYSYARAEA